MRAFSSARERAKARAAEELNAQLEALVDSRTEELRRSAEKLEAANRLASLGTMAAGVAHQINNPIGSIRMSAEFALGAQQGDSDRDEAWRDALENAVVQSERCGEIVSSMLQFARNEPTQNDCVEFTVDCGFHHLQRSRFRALLSKRR